MTHRYKNDGKDIQPPQTGKVDNDHNKLGKTRPTQSNEGERTPASRHDREAQVGGTNQSKTRKGAPQVNNARGEGGKYH
jgi:hypothetical protein